MDCQAIVNRCKEKKIKVGSVESMTGGLFGATYCAIPGASNSYLGGIISYDPSIKIKFAHVKKEDIERYGIVSEQVALEMAEGGLEALGVDICLSVTGNAGPTSQVGEAPVGEYCLGLAKKEKSIAKTLHGQGNRNQIREQAVQAMFELLEKEI